MQRRGGQWEESVVLVIGIDICMYVIRYYIYIILYDIYGGARVLIGCEHWLRASLHNHHNSSLEDPRFRAGKEAVCHLPPSRVRRLKHRCVSHAMVRGRVWWQR